MLNPFFRGAKIMRELILKERNQVSGGFTIYQYEDVVSASLLDEDEKIGMGVYYGLYGAVVGYAIGAMPTTNPLLGVLCGFIGFKIAYAYGYSYTGDVPVIVSVNCKF